MGDYVRVESVDALTKFRAALCKFAEVVGVALDEAETEVLRTGLWVRQEQHDYWKRQVATRAELYTRAKSLLAQKKMQTTALGGRPSCVDEEKALAVAVRRLEEAKEKQANVRRWGRLLDEECFTYQGLTQGLRIALQSEIPAALAQLDNMVAALEAYFSTPVPEEQRSVASAGAGEERPLAAARGATGESMARGVLPASGAGVEAYGELRARTPSQAVRDTTAISAPAWPRSAVRPPEEVLRAALAGCDLARTPIVPEDKIVLARGIWQAARVYVERIATTAGDSGWYLGCVDDTVAAGHDGVRVADVLAARPEWAALLELPAGCLVVLDGASLVTVVDAQGRRRWPADVRETP